MNTLRSLLLANFVLLAGAGDAVAQVGPTGGRVSGGPAVAFGVVDALVGYGSGSIASLTQLSSGGNTSSRLGFRGAEDLGGGLAAGYWLEAGFNTDTGIGATSNSDNQSGGTTSGNALSFNRRSTVSLSDLWGEVRLGRDFTATYRNRDQTDPFFTNGVGASQPNVATLAGPTATRASNMAGYFLPPDLGGLFGEVQYFLGENISNSLSPKDNSGNGYAVRLGYGVGPFAIAVATGLTEYAQSQTTGDIRVLNVGATLDLPAVKLSAGYYRDKVEQFVPVTGTGYIVGVVLPVGADSVKLAWSSYGTDAAGDPRADKLAIGYVYAFSKRTVAYTTFAWLRNKGGSSYALNGSLTAADRSSHGYDLGMRHNF
ncbi:MAG: porin [Variovorax sp.]